MPQPLEAVAARKRLIVGTLAVFGTNVVRRELRKKTATQTQVFKRARIVPHLLRVTLKFPPLKYANAPRAHVPARLLDLHLRPIADVRRMHSRRRL